MSIFGKKQKAQAFSPDEREVEFLKRLSEVHEGYTRQISNMTEDHKRELTELGLDQQLAIKELQSKHKLALDQRDFDLKNHKDTEITKAYEERDKAVSESAILKKELEVTQKIVDINSDIVDVKDIINKLITALPKIDLNSITVNSK
jgi:hypothetical protein